MSKNTLYTLLFAGSLAYLAFFSPLAGRRRLMQGLGAWPRQGLGLGLGPGPFGYRPRQCDCANIIARMRELRAALKQNCPEAANEFGERQ